MGNIKMFMDNKFSTTKKKSKNKTKQAPITQIHCIDFVTTYIFHVINNINICVYI